jgi:hypothetical protein
MSRLVHVTITRTREIGGRVGGISITLTSDDAVELDTVMVRAVTMIDQAESTLNGWLEANDIKATMTGTVTSTANPVMVVPASEICVTMKDGKRYFKVKGGEYSEHGINFWPEHMKANGIDPKLIPDSGHTCKPGTTMVVEMVEGKPKRVLRLEQGS